MEKKKRFSITSVNFWVDLLIFIWVLFTFDPNGTGIAWHEWLSIAFFAAFVTHLLLHWDWILQVTRRFFAKLPIETRINYILNILLFVDMVVILFTGLVISRVALPAVGLSGLHGFVWRSWHDASANLFMLIMALHLALHRKWIVSTAVGLWRRTFKRSRPVVPSQPAS
jgi:uncharacterized membrane-anchored protein YitT (DUF2179 family)